MCFKSAATEIEPANFNETEVITKVYTNVCRTSEEALYVTCFIRQVNNFGCNVVNIHICDSASVGPSLREPPVL
jgi:hypothetical protein